MHQPYIITAILSQMYLYNICIRKQTEKKYNKHDITNMVPATVQYNKAPLNGHIVYAYV